MPYNLIICINEGNISIKYPLDINFSFLNLQFPVEYNYKLTGTIKKSVEKGRVSYECIYLSNGKWVVSDGYGYMEINSPYEHQFGNVIMLFYSSKNL